MLPWTTSRKAGWRWSRSTGRSRGLFYDVKVKEYARQPLRPVTLSDLVTFSSPVSAQNVLRSAQVTRDELPRRLARRVEAFRGLPFIVGMNRHIQMVYQRYQESFDILRAVQRVESEGENAQFVEILVRMVEEHTQNVPTLAKGFRECQRYLPRDLTKEWLDRAIVDRISIRLIAEQHIALSRAGPEDHSVGVVDKATSPRRLGLKSASFVRDLCELTYGVSPKLKMTGDLDCTLTTVPVHLDYILTELLKNSFRASVESAQRLGKADYPLDVEMTIAKSKSDGTCSIRIRDFGGGISAADFPRIFEYSFTTVRDEGSADEAGDNISLLSSLAESALQTGMGTIAGLGYGLGLSRCYAEYFGGSLVLVTMEGLSTDAFLTMPGIDRFDPAIK